MALQVWMSCVPTYVADANKAGVNCRWKPKFQEYCFVVLRSGGIGRKPWKRGVDGNTGCAESKLYGNGLPVGNGLSRLTTVGSTDSRKGATDDVFSCRSMRMKSYAIPPPTRMAVFP